MACWLAELVFKPREVCLKSVPLTSVPCWAHRVYQCLAPISVGNKGSRHPGRQAEVVLREMAVRAPFLKTLMLCVWIQAWPLWMSIPCPGLWPSSSALSCRCVLRRVPDCSSEQPPLLRLQLGWTLQTCFHNGWVVSTGKTC